MACPLAQTSTQKCKHRSFQIVITCLYAVNGVVDPFNFGNPKKHAGLSSELREIS